MPTNKIYASFDMTTNKIKNIGDATDAQDAVAYHQVAHKFIATIGNGSLTSFTINHSLNTQNVICQIRETSLPYQYIEPFSIQSTDSNNILITFSVAPSSNQYTVIII